MPNKYLLISHNEDIAPAVVEMFDSEEERRQHFINRIRELYYHEAINCLKAKHKFDSYIKVDEKTFDFMTVHVASVEAFVDAINPTRDPNRTFRLEDIDLVKDQIKTQSFMDSLHAYLELQQNKFFYDTQTQEIYTIITLDI